jgi:uncharacterized protein
MKQARHAGIGLRLPHHRWVMEQRPSVRWFEIHAENYMTESVAAAELEQLSRDYPLSIHAVGLSLGSVCGPDPKHLERLRELVTRYEPCLVSDHLSWSAVDGIHLPDLLPLPHTEESLDVFASGVDRAQSVLRREILIENPSKYFPLTRAMSEADFLSEIVRRTGCGVLLDINNIYVSARNMGRDPSSELLEYLEKLPSESIGELHLAGHAVVTEPGGNEQRIDDHGSPVCEEVWKLFRVAVETLGARPTLIEWDTRLPSFEVLAAEAGLAQSILEVASTSERQRVVTH